MKASTKILIVAGLPKAGKSLLTGGLYEALRQKKASFFVTRLSPDSEGQWTWESGKEELARELKNKIKNAGEFFSPAFVEFKCREIVGLARGFEILVLDLGGIPSEENRRFISTAKSCGEVTVLLLYTEGQDYREWENFLMSNGLQPLLIRTAWDFSKDLKSQAVELAKQILSQLGI